MQFFGNFLPRSLKKQNFLGTLILGWYSRLKSSRAGVIQDSGKEEERSSEPPPALAPSQQRYKENTKAGAGRQHGDSAAQSSELD